MSILHKPIYTKGNQRVFVGMSGGVDSSVAALLLQKQGYDVVGIFMRCYNLDGCSERDAEDARRVAERLKIPFYVLDFEEEYKKRVIKYMVDGYRAGITPNPDVMCNKEIKFGLFFKKALAMGADYVSTGHYVRKFEIRKPRLKNFKIRRYALRIAKDLNKDQSYFLWTLTEDQIGRCLFPIGDYLKPAVREIAQKAKLPTADKKDSQGICFLGKISIEHFLRQYIPEKRGELLTISGEKIGEHHGSAFYTIGQRHLNADFTFPKTGAALRKPFYVVAKDNLTNTVVVAEGDKNSALYKKNIVLAGVNIINPSLLSLMRSQNGDIAVSARVRYRQPLAPARLSFGVRGKATLIFDHAQKFIAPGQSAVFYSRSSATGKEMLGGGVII